MIDGQKLLIKNWEKIDVVTKRSDIDFKLTVDSKTGEVYPGMYSAKYKGLRFRLDQYGYHKNLWVNGSLYEYYTGQKNYENFSVKEARDAFQCFCEELGLRLTEVYPHRLEWGLGLENLNCNAGDLLSNTISFKGKEPKVDPLKGAGMMKTFELCEWLLKIYDKGLQEGKGRNLLRYELKLLRASILRRKGIFTAQDLFKPSIVEKLCGELIQVVTHLIFYDYQMDVTSLNKRDKNLFLQYNSPGAWSNLMRVNPELYRKKKVVFRSSVTRCSGRDWNKELIEALKDEISRLN
jgi:hypothetical protein